MTRAGITYRPVAERDFDAMHALVSHWEVTRNLGSWPWPPDKAFTRKRCVPFEGDGFVWAICEDDALIGTVSVVRGELGYMLHPDHHGKGIVSLATQSALTHAFDELGLEDVHADIWSDNEASKHILTKFGFTLSVQEVVHALARDEPTDSETYTLSRSAWLARNLPSLKTERLLLRPLRSADADAIAQIAGDYAVSSWLTPVPHPYSVTDAYAFLDRVMSGDEGPVWAITRDEGPLIGVIGLSDALGYYLHPDHWGTGVMTEAVMATIWYRFTDPRLERIASGYFDGNHGSRRVLEKAGFEPDGVSNSFSQARGEPVPLNRMVLDRARWTALMQTHEYSNASPTVLRKAEP